MLREEHPSDENSDLVGVIGLAIGHLPHMNTAAIVLINEGNHSAVPVPRFFCIGLNGEKCRAVVARLEWNENFNSAVGSVSECDFARCPKLGSGVVSLQSEF